MDTPTTPRIHVGKYCLHSKCRPLGPTFVNVGIFFRRLKNELFPGGGGRDGGGGLGPFSVGRVLLLRQGESVA